MRRRKFISVIAGAAVWPLGLRAEQPAMPVIGVLDPAPVERIAHLLAARCEGICQESRAPRRQYDRNVS
jgi:hypothetical protein